MRKFEVLFDHSERNDLSHPAFDLYGPLGFPKAPGDRPWLFTNFVQTLDGVASLRGWHSSGGDISQSPEDRWLMDLLRAHADAVLLGVGTLIAERALRPSGNRGISFRIADAELRHLRGRLGRQREMNIFVTGTMSIDLEDYKVFDPDSPVATAVITTDKGFSRVCEKRTHPHVPIIVAGQGEQLDFEYALARLRSEFGIELLLCEGGPTLNGSLTRRDLVDERFLTVSPIEVGVEIPREQEPAPFEQANPPKTRPTTFSGPGRLYGQELRWEWLSCRRVESHQFNRYRRAR